MPPGPTEPGPAEAGGQSALKRSLIRGRTSAEHPRIQPVRKKEKRAHERQNRRLLQERQRTKHARLARKAARRQRRLAMVEVMRADVVREVGGARGHPEGRGTEET